MVGTVTTDLVFFTGATGGSTSNCDAITDWLTAPTLDTENFVQGTGACAAKVSKTVFTSVFSLVGALDLTGKQIFVWAMCSGRLDTKAGNGLRIRVENAAAQFGEWTIAGRDTWGGGWMPFTVHTSTAFDAGATIPDVTAVTKVGIVFDVVGSATANNCWWDAMRYGTGLSIKGGTVGSPATFQDFLDAEAVVLTGKYGVIFEYEGLLIVQGKLTFGSTTLDDVTYFKDITGRVLIFGDKPIPADYYEIKLQGNANTAVTKIYFGEKIGGSGVSGITVRASSSGKPFKVTASDTQITEYGFYGCVFYQAATITLQAYSTVKEFLDCAIIKSAEMLPDTGIVKNCTFSSSAGRAIRMTSATDHHITDSKFINCQTAVHINFSAVVTINNVNFYGNNPYDIEHSVAGALTINYVNCPSPPLASKVNETGGGSTTIQASVTLTIRHVKTGTEPAECVRCYIRMKETPYTEIMNMDATTADDQNPTYYKATMSYTATGIVVIVRAREKGYLPFEIEATITSGGLDVSAVWIVDPNFQP